MSKPSRENIYQFRSHGQSIQLHLPDLRDHIPRQIREQRNFYELGMLEDVCSRLPEQATVVDVGANIGNHTVFFAKIAGAHTISFEPNPVALALLRDNIELNALQSRTEVHAVGLGEKEARGAVVNDSPSNLGCARVELGSGGEVEIRRLDDVVGTRHVDLIKIDVEGMEPMVLRGAKATLARSKPLVLAEAAKPEQLALVEAELRPLGYRKRKVYNHTPTYLFEYDSGADRVLDRIDPRVLAKLPPTKQIVAGMATVAGNEVALRATVMSLLPQVDRLFVYLNHFREVPEFLRRISKVSCFVDTDGRRYGDAGKFWGLEQSPDSVYLTCDDDLIYPPNFAERMIEELAEDAGRAAVGVHGSLILQPCPGYYRDGSRAVLHFEHPLMRRRRVHVVATNACAFHSSVVRMTLADFRAPNMADIWLAQYLQQQGLPAYVVPRPRRWLVPIEVNRPTIYEQSRAGSGSAFDSSRRQDEVLSGMYPVSLLDARDSAAVPPVLLFSAERAEGVSETIAAFAGRHRDVIAVVVDRSADGSVRSRALDPALGCEVHVVRASDDPARRSAYRQLFERARSTSIHCGVLRHPAGASHELEQLDAGQWKTLLP
jgi:FkbM family methyltransferase